MKDIIDYDPFTKTTLYHHYDPDTDITTIQEVQDVDLYLERSKALRNDEDLTKRGIKGGFWLYASIPTSILNILYSRGIDPFNKDQAKDVLKVINTEYPWLKTTTKNHA